MEENDKGGKVIRFPRQFRPIPGGKVPASAAEVREVMREVEGTLRLTHHVIKQLERDTELLAERTSRHTNYILAIVQTLLKAGLEVKLTSKDPAKD